MQTPKSAYDRRRLRQWLAGEARADGVSRRDMLRLLACRLARRRGTRRAGHSGRRHRRARHRQTPARGSVHRARHERRDTVRRLAPATTPPTTASSCRNHTATPLLAAADWKPGAWGDGLTRHRAVDFSLADLKKLPSVTHSAFVECAATAAASSPASRARRSAAPPGPSARSVSPAGAGPRLGVRPEARGSRPTGRGRPAPGARRRLRHRRRHEPRPGPPSAAAVQGTGRRTARLRDERRTAAARPRASRAGPRALVDRHRLRQVGRRHPGVRPTAVLTVEHRLLPPVRRGPPGRGQCSPDPADDQERLGAGRRGEPDGGRHSPAHRTVLVRGGRGRAGGREHRRRHRAWTAARLHDAPRRDGWVRWSTPWRPPSAGTYTLLARATDTTGRTQPDATVHNTQGYLFDAVVRHTVNAV
ncbi:hypothetical protein STENM327S_03997 [Streptomyces tendae]